jgi:adenine-specific DNA methylase
MEPSISLEERLDVVRALAGDNSHSSAVSHAHMRCEAKDVKSRWLEEHWSARAITILKALFGTQSGWLSLLGYLAMEKSEKRHDEDSETCYCSQRITRQTKEGCLISSL